MFSEKFRSNYSVRTKSEVSVLEIATQDLKKILHRVYLDYFKEVALKKHIMLLDRIKSIISASSSKFQELELQNFYNTVSDTIVTLYPTATNKIARRVA